MASNVVTSVSNYAKRMARLSARIFGEVARPTNSRSMKVVKLYSAQPMDRRPEVVDYYPHHVELTSLMKRLRYLGLYRSVAFSFITDQLTEESKLEKVAFHKIPISAWSILDWCPISRTLLDCDFTFSSRDPLPRWVSYHSHSRKSVVALGL